MTHEVSTTSRSELRAADAAGVAAGEDTGFLKLEQLTKIFPGGAGVKGIDVSIAEGELVAFLGPSGCGKTTTLRMIAGFIKNDSGRILLDGKRIDQLPSRQRMTAMVFQDYALFPNMTVFDNVAFGLRMRHVPKKDIGRRVASALQVVQLTNVESKYPKELSGGMRQRVALARAIVVEPRVLLLDEPLSNLDAKLRKSVRTELREIHERLGITTVLVTHDLEEAFSIGDRVVVMHDGGIEQFGSPQQIYSRPANTFVADFVGHTNMVEGVWLPGTAGRGLFRGGGLELVTATNPDKQRPAVFSVPPNNVRVSFEAEPPVADNVLRATIQSSSFLGSFYSLHAVVGEAAFNVSVVTGSIDEDEIADGREIWITWSAAEGDCVPA